jgi:hypothetical protein
LRRIEAVLGFHEDAGKDEGPSPSPAVLRSLLDKGVDPEEIWAAVLIKAVAAESGDDLPTTISDLVSWARADIERTESFLRAADGRFSARRSSFLLVFDALDRLGRDWGTITRLSEGILRFVLDMRGFRAMRAKIFMRTDQANDDSLFRFADATKIRADAVKLLWQRERAIRALV